MTTTSAQIATDIIQHSCECQVGRGVQKDLIDIVIDTVTEAPRIAYFEAYFKKLDEYEKPFTKLVRSVWAYEEKIILANLKKLKKAFRQKDNEDDLADSVMYPKKQMEKRLSDGAKAGISTILEKEGQAALDKLGVDIAFDISDPEITAWLKEYTPKFSESLEDVNTKVLRRELIAGMEKGETIPELMVRVEKTFENWDKYRAEVIARTESNRAASRASLEAWKQSGVVKKKAWFANPGACPWCVDMDGTTVSLERTFFDKGDVFTNAAGNEMVLDYIATSSPPLHPNCRCSILPIT